MDGVVGGLPHCDVRSYALLLKAHCAAGDAQTAEEVLQRLYLVGVTVDAAAVSTVMNAMVCQSPPDIDGARRLMEQVHMQSLHLSSHLLAYLPTHLPTYLPPCAAFADLASDTDGTRASRGAGNQPFDSARRGHVQHPHQGIRELCAAAARASRGGPSPPSEQTHRLSSPRWLCRTFVTLDLPSRS